MNKKTQCNAQKAETSEVIPYKLAGVMRATNAGTRKIECKKASQTALLRETYTQHAEKQALLWPLHFASCHFHSVLISDPHALYVSSPTTCEGHSQTSHLHIRYEGRYGSPSVETTMNVSIMSSTTIG